MSNGGVRWYSTIRIKIILVVIVSCTVVLGGLSIFNMLKEQDVLSKELEKLAEVTSQRLSKHLIGPMWDLDNDLVNDTIEAEMLEDDIHAIVIWDADTKQVFSARERGPDGRLIESTGAIAGDFIQSKNMVNTGSKDIGEVAVFVSRKNLQQALTESTISNIITLIILIVVMATVMTVVMGHIIIGPITRLAKHADDISHGDLKQTIKVESSDEIGQLAEAFHRMQTSLRVAFKRIYAKAKT